MSPDANSNAQNTKASTNSSDLPSGTIRKGSLPALCRGIKDLLAGATSIRDTPAIHEAPDTMNQQASTSSTAINTRIKQDFDYEKKTYNTKRASRSYDQELKADGSLSLACLTGRRKSSGDECSEQI